MIKNEITEVALVTAQGTYHTLGHCKPGRIEVTSLVVEDNGPSFDPFVWKQMFKVSTVSVRTMEIIHQMPDSVEHQGE